jgi:CRP/FNR family nitrogen fixation transcriptional regulator
MESLAAIIPYRRGEEIYAQGDPAEYWYRVVSGATRKCAVTATGLRHVVDFSLPDDFFGFSAREEYVLAAEAVAESTVLARYPHRQVERLADHDAGIRRYIREIALQAVARSEARTLILGLPTERERVGSFLAALTKRTGVAAANPPPPAHVIADCLGLSVGTVSRILRDFHAGLPLQPAP